MADSLDSLILGEGREHSDDSRGEKTAAEENRRLEEEIAQLQLKPLNTDAARKNSRGTINQPKHTEPVDDDQQAEDELQALFNEWSSEGGKPRAQEPQAPRYTIPTPSATLGNDGLGKRLKPSNDAEGSNKEDVRKSSTTSVALPSLTGLLGNSDQREKSSESVAAKAQQSTTKRITPVSETLRSMDKENDVTSAVRANPPLPATSSGLLSKRLAKAAPASIIEIPTLETPLLEKGNSVHDGIPRENLDDPSDKTSRAAPPLRSKEALDRGGHDKLPHLSGEFIKANLERHEAERMARRAQENLEAKIADLARARATDELRAKDEVERLNWKAERAREELEDERSRYEERIRRLEEQRSLDKQRAEEELRRAVADEAKRQELAMERIVHQHRREVDALKSDHDREIHLLKRKHDAEMASLKASSGERDKLSELTTQMVAHMTQWDDIASAVKGTTALTEQMKAEQLSARESFVKSLETSMKEQQRQIEMERSKLSELTREMEEEQKQHRLTREKESQRLEAEHVRLQELQETARQMQRDSKSALFSRETAVESAVRNLNEQKLALESQQKAFELDREDQERRLRSEWEKLRCVQKSVDLSLMATQRRANEAEVAVARHRDRAAAEMETIEKKSVQVNEDSAELKRRLVLLRQQEADVRADMNGMVEMASRLKNRAQQVAEAYAAAEHVRAEAHRLHAELSDRENELVEGAKEMEEMKREIEEQRLRVIEAETAVSARKLEMMNHTDTLGGITTETLVSASSQPNLRAALSSAQVGHRQSRSMSRVTTRPQLLRSVPDADKWRKLKEEAMQIDEYILKHQECLTAVRTMTTTQLLPAPLPYPSYAALQPFPRVSAQPVDNIRGAEPSPGISTSHHSFVPLRGSPQATTFWPPPDTRFGTMNVTSTSPVGGGRETISAPLEPLSSLTSSDQDRTDKVPARRASIPPINVAAAAVRS